MSWAHPAVKGSISLASAKNTPLPSLAKISLSQAVSTVEREANGKIVEASLGDEDGFLTYLVTVLNPDQKVTEFNVDAGNGQILSRNVDKLQSEETCPDAKVE